MTPAQINAYLRGKGSPLAGQGGAFVREGRRNGIDPLLMVAIAGAESSFGKNESGRFNPFGWGPGIGFASYPDAIAKVARGLRRGYADQGLKTIAAIGGKWAPSGAANDPTNLNSNWTRNVTSFYRELGGSGWKGTSTRGRAATGLGGTATPTTAITSPPDLTGLALSNLAAIGAGESLDPSEQLAALTRTIASSTAAPPMPAASPATPTAKMPTATSPPGKLEWTGKPLTNMDTTFLSTVERAAADLGATQIRVTSASRDPAYNKKVGGVPRSNHPYGHALDGDAYLPGRGWVPLGTLLLPVAGQYGLRSGDVPGFYRGDNDPPHVDDGYNQR